MLPSEPPQPWKRHAQLWKLHANKDQPVVAFATTGWPSFACTSRASSMEKTAFLGVSLEKDKNPWERKKTIGKWIYPWKRKAVAMEKPWPLQFCTYKFHL